MTDEELIKCYGKQKLRKVRNANAYTGTCRRSCPLRDACISRSREDQEFVISQLASCPLDDGRRSTEDNRTEIPAALIHDPEHREPDGIRGVCDAWMPGVPPDIQRIVWPHVHELLHRMAHMSISAPKQFSAAMRRLFLDESQSEQARIAGVTRQAISSGILLEYAGSRKPDEPDNVPKNLSGMEAAVHALLWEKKLSIRAAAAVLGWSKSKTARVGHLIASKIGKIRTPNRVVSEKKTKKIKSKRRSTSRA